MAMNLLQVVDRLKDLSDGEIQRMMQSPPGEVPTWAVYSEAARRKEMRDNASKPPQTTVGDDLEQTMQPQQQVGLDAIAQQMRPQQAPMRPGAPPGMPQGMPTPPPGMARGGMIRMQEGGSIERQTPIGWEQSYLSELKKHGASDWEIRRILDRHKYGPGDQLPSDLLDEVRNQAVRRAGGGPIRMADGGMMDVGQTEFDWIGPLAAQLRSEGVPEWQINSIIAQQERAKKEAQFRGQPPIVPEGIINPSIPNQPGPVQDVAAHVSTEQPWSGILEPSMPTPPIPPSGGPGQEVPGIKKPPSAVTAARNVADYGASPASSNKFTLPEDDEWKAERSAIDDLIKMSREGREDKEKRKNDVLWRNLLMTGLNIMAAGSKTGSALGAIGAGGAAGVKGLIEDMKDLDKQDREAILDELKARTLKVDSMYRKGAIDAQMFGHQIQREVGLARAAAARSGGGSSQVSATRLRVKALEDILFKPGGTLGLTPGQIAAYKSEYLQLKPRFDAMMNIDPLRMRDE